VRDLLLALVLVIFGLLELRRYILEDYLWHVHGACYHWKVLQLGFDYALHGFVSKFCMQNFFIEWL
jgi:hypothetical protein